MKIIRKIIPAIALISMLLSSCQSSPDTEHLLSNKETRQEIMGAVANDPDMTNEMMEAIMNNSGGKMMVMGNHKMTMMEDHAAMRDMMRDNPVMMHHMMTDMLEACKGDSSLMSGMCKSMMENQQMMNMMQQMNGTNGNMRMMEGMQHKM